MARIKRFTAQRLEKRVCAMKSGLSANHVTICVNASCSSHALHPAPLPTSSPPATNRFLDGKDHEVWSSEYDGSGLELVPILQCTTICRRLPNVAFLFSQIPTITTLVESLLTSVRNPRLSPRSNLFHPLTSTFSFGLVR